MRSNESSPSRCGYTELPPGRWSRRAGWRAAWRWRGGTRSAFSAGRPPAFRSHVLDTQTLYSGGEIRKKKLGPYNWVL